MKDLSNENIIHVNKNGMEYLQFRKLLEYSNLKHAFTLRPLDFAGIIDYEEKKEMVKRNYKDICEILGMNDNDIYRPQQTHTGNVAIVNNQIPGTFTKEFKNIDALITDQKEKALVLAFADCTPLLFFDPIKNIIANTHSGWRGTVQMIGKNTVEKMISVYNCNPSDIICCIGPTIRQCHFEVDEDVKDIFYSQFKDKIDINKYIINSKTKYKNKYYIDTVGVNREILLNVGLRKENIIDSKICSVCHEDKIHSYRAHGKQAGRNISIMELK